MERDPRVSAVVRPTPVRARAMATAPLVRPTFPGVKGIVPLRSRAGTTSIAATSGDGTPSAAAIEAAAPSRASVARPIHATMHAPRLGSRPSTRNASRACATRVLAVRLRVVRAPSTTSPPWRTGRHGPERQRAGDRARDDQQREHEGAGNANHSERASRLPEPLVAVERAREQRQPRGVADPGRRERVDQRADPVACACVQPADASADEPDRRPPRARSPDQRARKQTPASHSQIGRALESPASARRTSGPSSEGTNATASSATVSAEAARR